MSAWSYGPYRTPTGPVDDRLGAAFIAIKRELVWNGFGKNIVPDTPVFGDAATNRVKDFQSAKGLKVDGQVGPSTARELFRKRTESFENIYELERGTLGKLVTLESAWDPVAVGYADPDDHGLVQINLLIHSDVSVEQAYDPDFALQWAASYMYSSERRIALEANLFKAARASYNTGVEYAKRWMLAGFPATGGDFDSSGIDWYVIATKYIQLIDGQNW